METDYALRDRIASMNFIQQHHASGEVVTGLRYLDPAACNLHQHLNTVHAPLNTLNAAELTLGADILARINVSLR